MRVLIVDDEEHVRTAIRLLVHWTQYGITQIEEASDGEQAIACMIIHPPQILITDMMMPNVGGMKLMEWTASNCPETKIIAVSAHHDFHLVRHTMKHGGIDYILKPIDPDAVNEAIHRAVTACRQEDEERHMHHIQQKQVNEYRPIISEKLWSSLLDDPSAQAAALRRLRADFDLPFNIQTCRVAVAYVDADEERLMQRFGDQPDLLYFSLVNIMNEVLSNQDAAHGVAFRHWNVDGEIGILQWNPSIQLEHLLTQINDALFATLHHRLHYGISREHPFPQEVYASYQEANLGFHTRNLLEQQIYQHPAWQDSSEAVESLKGLRLSDYYERWKIAILSGSIEAIEAAAADFIATSTQTGCIIPLQIQRWSQEWETLRTQLIQESTGHDAEKWLLEFPLQPFTHRGIVGGSFSIEKWQHYWFNQLMQLSKMLADYHTQEQHIIFDIAKYIDQHYQEDLSLYDMAQRFYVSREYISRKFKQQFGINLSDYLAQIRMEKAQSLLLNPHLRIGQIAAMVGYRDEKYFSKVFKKETGLSPVTYRRQHQV